MHPGGKEGGAHSVDAKTSQGCGPVKAQVGVCLPRYLGYAKAYTPFDCLPDWKLQDCIPYFWDY